MSMRGGGRGRGRRTILGKIEILDGWAKDWIGLNWIELDWISHGLDVFAAFLAWRASVLFCFCSAMSLLFFCFYINAAAPAYRSGKATLLPLNGTGHLNPTSYFTLACLAKGE